MSSFVDRIFRQSLDTYLFYFALLCLLIGIICAASIVNNDTDEVKGNKRVVAVFFIMLFFLLVVAIWTKRNCNVKEVINKTIREYGYEPVSYPPLGNTEVPLKNPFLGGASV
jgi:ABC-type sugar transport system permease subunit